MKLLAGTQHFDHREQYQRRILMCWAKLRMCVALTWVFAALSLPGCDSGPSDTAGGVANSPTIQPSQTAKDSTSDYGIASDSKKLTQKLKFKVGEGEHAFSIKPETDGGKLVDSDESELARFKLQDGKLKIKTADETILAYIVPSAGKLKIKNADQSQTLWTLRSQADGDWKLEDTDDNLVYKIKRRDYGFELEDGSENSLAKAKQKADKTSLRDPSEATLFYTKDPIKPESVICLGFESIKALSVRAGLMFMVEIGASESK